MVTVAEIEKREDELREVEQQARSIQQKQIPQRRFGFGVTKQQQQDVVKQRQQATETISQISQERSQLQQVKSSIQDQQLRQEKIQQAVKTGNLIGLGRQDRQLVQAVREGQIQRVRATSELKITKQTIATEGLYETPEGNVVLRSGEIVNANTFKVVGSVPTLTEIQSNQSLPEGVRQARIEEVRQSQSIQRPDSTQRFTPVLPSDLPRSSTQNQFFERLNPQTSRQQEFRSKIQQTRAERIRSFNDEVARFRNRFEGRELTIEEQSIARQELEILESKRNKLIREQESINQREEVNESLFERSLRRFDESQQILADKTTKPISEFIAQRTGLTKERFAEVASLASPSIIGVGSFGIGGKESREFSRGLIEGVISEVQEKPLELAILGILGAGVSAGAKGAGLGLEALKITKFPNIIKVTQATATGAGVVAGGIYTANLGKELIKITDLRGAGNLLGREAVGVTAVGVGSIVGVKGFNKALDVGRTLRATEVDVQDIVAKEYFQGQRYPKIRKGQTAGELKQEFFVPIKSLKEADKLPRMFTASPSTFSKKTTAQAGSSELAGLYGSPRLSATFLKVSGEDRSLFGVKGLFEVSRPTALRTEVGAVRLAPRVSPKQKRLRPLNEELKRFVEFESEKGVAVIPFVKTEKEAVLPVGSKINVRSKDFFFKFQGRRVPVFEAITERETLVSTRKGRPVSLKQYLSSYNKDVSSAFLNPLDVPLLSSSRGRASSSIINKKDYSSIVSSPSSIPSSSISKIPKSSYSPLRSSGVSSVVSLPKSAISSIVSSPSSSRSSFRRSSRSSSLLSSNFRPKKSMKSSTSKPIKVGSKREDAELNEVFNSFIIRGKKKKSLGQFTRGRALAVGEREALKTLGATFGVEATGKKTRQKDIDFNLSKAFRTFKFQGGKKVPLNDLFIQKSGTRRDPTIKGARLASRSEINELISLRRRR